MALFFFLASALSPPRCGGVGARRAPLVKKNSPDTPAAFLKTKVSRNTRLTKNFDDVLRAALRAWTLRLPAARQISFAKSVFRVNFCSRRVRQQTRTLNLIRLRGAAVSASRTPLKCCPRLPGCFFQCRRIIKAAGGIFSLAAVLAAILAGFDSGRF